MTNKEHRHLLYKDEGLNEQRGRQIRISDEARALIERGRDHRDNDIHSLMQRDLFRQMNEELQRITEAMVGQPRGRQQGAQMREMLHAMEEATYVPTAPLEYTTMSIQLNE